MSQLFRNPVGGLVDRDREIAFTFNGSSYHGYRGDTLASALLANGVRLVGRSFKYHRPRGVFGLGAEEPNALVRLGTGARAEPNTKATQIELQKGLSATSQNCWPGVGFDVGAIADRLSRLLSAGFYYKTFMWPPRSWMLYERAIRGAAGMGRATVEPDPDIYAHTHAYCDVLIVGGGPAGLAACLAAGRSGARTILVDDGPQLGGSLLATSETLNRRPAIGWVEGAESELRSLPEVRLILRATAFGYYDHNQIGVVERVADHRPPGPGEPRQRIWHVYARQVVLAAGAHERPMVFANNDRPGVMLASAARGYVNRFAVRPGTDAVVFTNNDSAYPAVGDLLAKGIRVRAVVDARPDRSQLASWIAKGGVEVIDGSAVVYACGSRTLQAVEVAAIDATGNGALRRIECDLLAVSGGWNPSVHLHAQSRGRPIFSPGIAAFVPGQSVQAERSAGAANGTFSLAGCLAEGARAGAAAANDAGFKAHPEIDVETDKTFEPAALRPVWRIDKRGARKGKCFVDLQDDVTDEDIALAVREGYRSVEHVKRYTTLGMGTDQGKTSNTNGFALVADALGIDIPAVGTTTYRPPFTPVTLGALAGTEGGRHFTPRRRTAMHDCHVASCAVLIEVARWQRPQAYPKTGESLDNAARREALSVRTGVGMVDVSTLGKVEIVGPDAVTFLERVYVNRFANLKVGRCRYGLMLREDGIVFDDGTVTRLGEDHFFLTTTTAQAPLAARRLTYWRMALWPELDVRIVDVIEQWAALAIAGPKSRTLLEAVASDGLPVSNEALPHMGMGAGTVAGISARVLRISFSGELAYEIYVPAGSGARLWEMLMESGKGLGLTPYGIDALNALRIEKGHVAGGELNGRVTADDLGLGRMISKEGDFIGKRSLARPGLNDPGRWQLVGFVPKDGRSALPQGAKIIAQGEERYIGELTSVTYSPVLDQPIALGLVAAGRQRHGEHLVAASPLGGASVEMVVTSPVFVDPHGERLRV